MRRSYSSKIAKLLNPDEVSVIYILPKAKKKIIVQIYFNFNRKPAGGRFFGQREITEVANESCLRFAHGAATHLDDYKSIAVGLLQNCSKALFDCCKRRRGTTELGIVVFNNPATLRCLSASTGTDFELEQSRVE